MDYCIMGKIGEAYELIEPLRVEVESLQFEGGWVNSVEGLIIHANYYTISTWDLERVLCEILEKGEFIYRDRMDKPVFKAEFNEEALKKFREVNDE